MLFVFKHNPLFRAKAHISASSISALKDGVMQLFFQNTPTFPFRAKANFSCSFTSALKDGVMQLFFSVSSYSLFSGLEPFKLKLYSFKKASTSSA